jgi:hypothetical protein
VTVAGLRFVRPTVPPSWGWGSRGAVRVRPPTPPTLGARAGLARDWGDVEPPSSVRVSFLFRFVLFRFPVRFRFRFLSFSASRGTRKSSVILYLDISRPVL